VRRCNNIPDWMYAILAVLETLASRARVAHRNPDSSAHKQQTLCKMCMQRENATCMKTVLRSSTRHDVVDETVPHSSVRSSLVANYCDPMVTTLYGTTDFLFCKPCHGWKIVCSSTRRRVADETVPHSSVRSFLVADYFDPMVTTFYGTDVLFWKRVMDEKIHRWSTKTSPYRWNSTKFIHETLSRRCNYVTQMFATYRRFIYCLWWRKLLTRGRIPLANK
jgi:hypothetical protein